MNKCKSNIILKSILSMLVVTITMSLNVKISHADMGDVFIEKAWARASIGKKRPSAAYMTIHNKSTATIILKSVSTPIAMRSEIHRTTLSESGTMSMGSAGEIKIAPKGAIALKPGGLHVMLMGLKSLMKEGETFPLTLLFSDGKNIVVNIPILAISSPGPEN